MWFLGVLVFLLFLCQLLDFWNSGEITTFLLRNQHLIAHKEAWQTLTKLDTTNSKLTERKGLPPKSRWLNRLHMFEMLTVPNPLIPLGAPLLVSCWIFELPALCFYEMVKTWQLKMMITKKLSFHQENKQQQQQKRGKRMVWLELPACVWHVYPWQRIFVFQESLRELVSALYGQDS